ncbi:SulP family inorganic anion transporter [Lentiprolixibacter aurantiacus]|uniref:Sulfate permease n=1 Tax=Lentiprolixibacter aurantiacus TaxID=2993939 RepID=A0AAE3MNM7_9FLAO|nr:sulfate permease [Lentiprolixibacter aurantiacus]MCX2720621.1 sulfate permease [Lentiprolixibacter aurantiacus]
MQGFLPVLDWISRYTRADIPRDLGAGLSVGILLVPQGMAYAMIAGLPPVYGLYASLFPLLVYTFFGTSRYLGIGPVAMDSLLVAAGLGIIGASSPAEYIALAIALAFFVGAIQLVLGLLRMGFLVNFLSRPVISGFISAAALIIMLSQLKHLFGAKIAESNRIYELIINAFEALPHIQPIDFTIGLLGILIIILIRKWNPRFPGILLVVVLGISAAFLFNLEAKGVRLVGAIPMGLPGFSMPELNVELVEKLWPIALTLAMIGYLEAVSIAKGIEDKSNEDRLDANQELRALGLSNMIGSFFQSYPVTASFSRSALLYDAGARSNLSGLISGLVVVATLLFLTPVFYFLPKAVLASIIMVTVFRLIDVAYARILWFRRRDEFFILVGTFLLTLFVGITEGILIGVLLSLVLMLHRTSKPHFAILENIRGTDYYRNVDRFSEDQHIREDLLIIRFDDQLYFGNCSFFKRQLFKYVKEKGPALKAVILNAEPINYIDSTATQMLLKAITKLREEGREFYITGAIGPLRDIIFNSELINVIPKSHLFVRIVEAVAYFDGKEALSPIQKKVTQQTKKSGN